MIDNNEEIIAVYARQSREQGTNGSIEDQIAKGKIKAESLGLKFQIYIDKNVSAANPNLLNRPECLKMIADIESGLISAIYVYDLSRLTRNSITNAYIKSIFKEYNIKVYTEIEGTINFQDSDNEFISDIKALINQKFVRDTANKIQSVLENRVSNGKAHGSIMKPYGYTADIDKNLIIDDEEAVYVKEIFNLSAAGMGTGTIANQFNIKDVFTKSRRVLVNGINRKNKFNGEVKHTPSNQILWAGNTILSILRNPIFKGQRLYKGKKYTAPAIISEELWDKVQIQLDNKAKPKLNTKHQFLLKGLCFCGRCGRIMTGRTRENKRDHYYQCMSKKSKSSCGNRSLNIDYLDEIVWYAVSNSSLITGLVIQDVNKLSDPKQIQSLLTEQSCLKKQLELEENGKLKLLNLYRRGIIELKDIEAELNGIKSAIILLNEKINLITFKISHHQHLISEIDSIKVFQERLMSLQLNLDLNQKRIIIEKFIEKVTVTYNDEYEKYAIQLHARMPHPNELIFLPLEEGKILNNTIIKELPTLYLDKGNKPNYFNYDTKVDSYERRRGKNSDYLLFSEGNGCCFSWRWR